MAAASVRPGEKGRDIRTRRNPSHAAQDGTDQPHVVVKRQPGNEDVPGVDPGGGDHGPQVASRLAW